MATLNLGAVAARWRWRLVRGWRQPLVGSVTLVLSLALMGAALTSHLRTSQRWQAQRRAQAAVPAAIPLPRTAAAERRIAIRDFYAALPAQDDLPQALQSLIDLAQSHGLRLLRGTYRLEPVPAARFARYRMSLPLRGDPAHVEQFVQAALLAFPTLAVDSIQFKPQAVESRSLDASVQWVMYVRAAVPGPGSPLVGDSAAGASAPAAPTTGLGS